MTAKNPLVVVVLVSYNNAKIIKGAIESVYSQSYKNYKIILVDNASQDGSVDVVRKNFPDVKIIESERNEGFSGGNNQGVKAALKYSDCRYIVLLNTDAELSSHWMEKLVTYAQSHPKGAGFQGLTLDHRDHTKVDSRGLIVNRMGLAIQIGYTEKRKRYYKTGEVFGVNAAACMYSRSFLESQPFPDYLDEDLFMYLEDVDISMRALVMGWSNYFVADAIAYHMGSASRRKFWSTRLLHRNSWLILLKNLPPQILLRVTRSYIKQEFKIYGRYIKEGDWLMILPALLGKIQSIFLLPAILKKRRLLKVYFVENAGHLWGLM